MQFLPPHLLNPLNKYTWYCSQRWVSNSTSKHSISSFSKSIYTKFYSTTSTFKCIKHFYNGYYLRYLLNVTIWALTQFLFSLLSAFKPVDKYRHMQCLEIGTNSYPQIIYRAIFPINFNSVYNVLILLLCHISATSLTFRD